MKELACVELPNLEATQYLAKRLSKQVVCRDVLALRGDLGVGKTEFARFFIRSLLCIDEIIPSPTFTLVQTYDCDLCPIWHFDLYRLNQPEEIYELGIEEAISEGITLIEWPERIENEVHLGNKLELHFFYEPDKNRRYVLLKGDLSWQVRFEKMHEV